MQIKEFSIALDMKRTLSFPPFEVVEGDTGNVLHVSLTNDGEAVALASCSVCIVFASSAGFAIQDLNSGITLGETTGTFSVSLYPNSYGAGDVRADVQVYSGEDGETLITSKRFTFRCIKGLMQPDIIRASSAYPPLVQATADARAATAQALAAAARIGNDIGEMNVQPDWTETDTAADGYIKNKPAAYAPSAHAHGSVTNDGKIGTDGNLPVFTGERGTLGTKTAAQARTALAITPDNIGAAAKSAISTATLLAATWVGADVPYTYTLSVAGVTAASAVEVLPGASITAEQLEALQGANIQDGGQVTGSITLKAFGDKPEIDLPVRIIVRGDL